MYIPKHFEITDEQKILAFFDENAFGQLVSSVNGRLFSTHIPFLLSDDGKTIFGHLAKQNPQCGQIEGQEVLVTLEGPHDYVSPSWYSSPGVPTWNYQAVHIYGEATVFTDATKLKSLVDTLTEQYESGYEQPWEGEYKSSMLGAIVGLEISIKEVQCKYKLSQNRSAQDQKNVAEQLEKAGSNRLAKAMRHNI